MRQAEPFGTSVSGPGDGRSKSGTQRNRTENRIERDVAPHVEPALSRWLDLSALRIMSAPRSRQREGMEDLGQHRIIAGEES